jgi:hypothetical protein
VVVKYQLPVELPTGGKKYSSCTHLGSDRVRVSPTGKKSSSYPYLSGRVLSSLINYNIFHIALAHELDAQYFSTQGITCPTSWQLNNECQTGIYNFQFKYLISVEFSDDLLLLTSFGF